MGVDRTDRGTISGHVHPNLSTTERVKILGLGLFGSRCCLNNDGFYKAFYWLWNSQCLDWYNKLVL